MHISSTRLGFKPSASALRAIDACAQDLAPEGDGLLEWHRSYLANHRIRIAHDLDIVMREIPVRNAILECGSIPLLLTAALTKQGYKVTGCDLAPERYSSTILAAGLNVVKCNIETERLPFDNDSFDAAIFNELFEHLRINPIHTLTELFRVIRPNGTLTLSTPNLKSLGGMRNFLMRDRAYSCSPDIYAEYKKLTDLGHMGHVREYTPTEVIEFLQRIGFEVTAIIFRGEYTGALSRTAIRLIPRLSPFVSYMAKKP